MTIIGTFYGMYFQRELVRRSGGSDRYTVLVMAIAVLVILISSASLTISTIVQKEAEGIDVFEFKSYC